MKNFKLNQRVYSVIFDNLANEYIMQPVDIYAFVTINDTEYILIDETLNEYNLILLSRCFDSIDDAMKFKKKCNDEMED